MVCGVEKQIKKIISIVIELLWYSQEAKTANFKRNHLTLWEIRLHLRVPLAKFADST